MRRGWAWAGEGGRGHKAWVGVGRRGRRDARLVGEAGRVPVVRHEPVLAHDHRERALHALEHVRVDDAARDRVDEADEERRLFEVAIARPLDTDREQVAVDVLGQHVAVAKHAHREADDGVGGEGGERDDGAAECTARRRVRLLRWKRHRPARGGLEALLPRGGARVREHDAVAGELPRGRRVQVKVEVAEEGADGGALLGRVGKDVHPKGIVDEHHWRACRAVRRRERRELRRVDDAPCARGRAGRGGHQLPRRRRDRVDGPPGPILRHDDGLRGAAAAAHEEEGEVRRRPVGRERWHAA